MGQTKKRHHYIPQFYLEGFTNETGRLFVLDQEKEKVNEQSKEGTFHKYKYYTVNFSKHEKRDPKEAQKMRIVLGIEHIDISNIPENPDMVENLLMDSETVSAPVIKKIISGQQITPREKIELSTFVAFMYTRNPSFLEFSLEVEKWMVEKHMTETFSSKEKIEEIYKEMKAGGYEKEFDPKEMFKIIQDKRFSVEIPREAGIQAMLMGTTMIDKMLHQKTWLLLEATGKSVFVTNDNPVFLDHPDVYEKGIFGVGFETPEVKIVFPLTSKYLLVMFDGLHNGAILHKKLDQKGVRRLNERIYERSMNYVMARSEDLIKRIQKSFV